MSSPCIRSPALLLGLMATSSICPSPAVAQAVDLAGYWLIEDSHYYEKMPRLVRMRWEKGEFIDDWLAEYTEEVECENGEPFPRYARIYAKRSAKIFRCTSEEFLEKCRWEMGADQEVEEEKIPEEPENTEAGKQDSTKPLDAILQERQKQDEILSELMLPPAPDAEESTPDSDQSPFDPDDFWDDVELPRPAIYEAEATIRVRDRFGSATISGTYKTERWAQVPDRDGFCRRVPEEDKEYEFELTRTKCPRDLDLIEPTTAVTTLVTARLTDLSTSQYREIVETAREQTAGICIPMTVVQSVQAFESTKSMNTCSNLCEEFGSWLIGIGRETGQDVPAGFTSRCNTQCGLVSEE